MKFKCNQSSESYQAWVQFLAAAGLLALTGDSYQKTYCRPVL